MLVSVTCDERRWSVSMLATSEQCLTNKSEFTECSALQETAVSRDPRDQSTGFAKRPRLPAPQGGTAFGSGAPGAERERPLWPSPELQGSAAGVVVGSRSLGQANTQGHSPTGLGPRGGHPRERAGGAAPQAGRGL